MPIDQQQKVAVLRHNNDSSVSCHLKDFGIFRTMEAQVTDSMTLNTKSSGYP